MALSFISEKWFPYFLLIGGTILKHFTKEWYVAGCNDSEKNQNYIDYMRSHLPRWYNDFSFHDSKIIDVEDFENLIVLNLEFDDFIHTKYQLKLYNPKITEYCKLQNSWWLFDEMYINENSFEFHIMVSDFDDNSIISYFTVKCSDIQLIFMGKTYNTKTPNNITVTYDYDILPENIENDFL